MTLTIFTPTYNRGYILPKLYESLINQSCKKFVWMIIDDGSTDNTSELVQKWKLENKVNIKYIKQENLGKMQAHNKGVLNCDTDLFFCVDSDDYLVNDAIEYIYSNCKINHDKKIAGMVTHRGKNDKQILGNKRFKESSYSTLRGLYEDGFRGDTSLIFKTEVLKNYLFPYIKNEKFISEGYVYDQIDQNYVMMTSNKILIICDYLDDGYTKNMNKILNKNPKSTLLVYNQRMSLKFRFKTKLLAAANFQAISWSLKEKKYLKDATNKILVVLAIPISFILLIRMRREGKNDYK